MMSVAARHMIVSMAVMQVVTVSVGCGLLPKARPIVITYKFGPLVVDKVATTVVTPGVPFTIHGSGFGPGVTLQSAQLVGGPQPTFEAHGFKEAVITLPPGTGFGTLDLTLRRDDQEVHLSLLSNGGLTGLPVVSAYPQQVCSDVRYLDVAGKVRYGSRHCGPSPAPCQRDGEQGCRATAARPAVAATGLAAKVIAGRAVAGVVGQAPAVCDWDGGINCLVRTPFRAADLRAALPKNIAPKATIAGVDGAAVPPCTSDAATGCLTTTSFRAADTTRVAAAQISTGVAIAGVTGAAIPESHASCTGDGRVACLASTSFPSAGLAGFTASDVQFGTTVAGVSGTATFAAVACTSDGQQNCVSLGAYKAGNVTGLSTWDVRIGKSLGGISGALKTNCRNTVNNTYFNWDGAIGSLPNTSQTGGSTNDLWDTVDDYNGFSTATVAGWSSNTLCDSSTWTDVTTADGGSTTTTCAASSANCQYRDNITNLVVTKNISASSTWSAAVQACNSSTYGGFSAGTWRLPTQKELMSLYEHGIVSLVSANFMTLATMQNYFWSSSTNASNTSYAWDVNLAYGITYTTKTNIIAVLCVR